MSSGNASSKDLLDAEPPRVAEPNLSEYERRLADDVLEWLAWARQNHTSPDFLGELDQFQIALERDRGIIPIPAPDDEEFRDLEPSVQALLLHWRRFLSTKDDELVASHFA